MISPDLSLFYSRQRLVAMYPKGESLYNGVLKPAGLEKLPGKGRFNPVDFFVRLHYLADNGFYSDWSLPARVIEDYEILYVVQGRGELSAGESRLPFQKGSLLVVPPGVKHSFSSTVLPLRMWCIHFNLYENTQKQQGTPKREDSPGQWVHGLVFDPRDPAGISLKKKELHLPLVTDSEKDPLLSVKLHRMSGLLDRTQRQDVSLIEKQLTAILEQLLAPREAEPRKRYAQAAAEYVDSSYREGIRLGDLAQLLHLERSYVSRLFKEEWGVSFSEYLTGRRVEEAKRLLRETGLTMDQVAEQSGFYDTSHLHRTFLKICGISPGAYRREKQND